LDRDTFMSAEEAKKFGIVDEIITDRNSFDKVVKLDKK
jgi:ATP-dependent protease ClpP protease subunit